MSEAAAAQSKAAATSDVREQASSLSVAQSPPRCPPPTPAVGEPGCWGVAIAASSSSSSSPSSCSRLFQAPQHLSFLLPATHAKLWLWGWLTSCWLLQSVPSTHSDAVTVQSPPNLPRLPQMPRSSMPLPSTSSDWRLLT